ncbi:MAG: hypothetical protein II655_06970, partial [Thermoguttaceae bacterium]|nr:hypothetical protein [Thermoguttaceae bacterium]
MVSVKEGSEFKRLAPFDRPSVGANEPLEAANELFPPPKDGPDNVGETSELNVEPVVASGAAFPPSSNEFELRESSVGVPFKLSDGESFNGAFADSFAPNSEGAPESDEEFQPSPFGREPS